jgi:hypothetical protein
MKVFLALSMLLALPAFAQTEKSEGDSAEVKMENKEFSERQGWKTDGGAAFLRNGHGLQLGLSTPKLFGFNHKGKEIAYSLNFFVEGDSFTDGKINDETGSLQNAKSFSYGLTLEKRGAVLQNLIQPYGKAGAVYIKPDSQVYDEAGLWGAYLAIGVDILTTSNLPKMWGGKTVDASFFAEASGVFGVGRSDGESDNQVASTDVYNGFRPLLGVRFHH